MEKFPPNLLSVCPSLPRIKIFLGYSIRTFLVCIKKISLEYLISYLANITWSFLSTVAIGIDILAVNMLTRLKAELNSGRQNSKKISNGMR